MRIFFFILLSSFLFFSCTRQQPDTTILHIVPGNGDTAFAYKAAGSIPHKQDKKVWVDKIFIGMLISDMYEVYKYAAITREPVYSYGIDGDALGYLVTDNTGPLLFAWNMESNDVLAGIVVLSPDIVIDGDIRVGMTYAEFKKRKPAVRLAIDSIDDKIEFGYVKEAAYRIEFLTTDTNRVGTYIYGNGEPEFSGIARPEATIDRISI